MGSFGTSGSGLTRIRQPATTALVGAIVLTYVLSYAKVLDWSALAFFPELLWRAPWTALTHPFSIPPGAVFTVLFASLWLWGIGGDLERRDGPLRMWGLWLGFSALCALSVWLGHLIVGGSGAMSSPWTSIAAFTVIWGTRNASAQVTLMFVLPISGKWLAWLSAGLVFFSMPQAPQLAPFAAAPLILAYLYAAQKLPSLGPAAPKKATTGRGKAYGEPYFEEVKRREKDREERERLKRLFESSLGEDDSEKRD